jgi:LytS/YehU family sensor histidine kinase
MTPSTGARTVANRLVGFAALTATIAVAVLAFAFAFGTPQTVVFNNIPFALLICATISASSIALMAVVMPLVYRRPAPVQWAVFLPTFALAGVIGTLLAAVIVGVLGVVPLSRIMAVFAQNIRGTVPTSMVIGAVLMALEHGKARLRATEAQLQQQRTERERAERLASEAQLASLTARVQPHFLFNTLNSIAALVRESPNDAERLIEQLSAVLRSSLDAATLVPLERELALVRDYLGIQHARFGDRLRFDVDGANPDLTGVMVPPFAVQTLVENAIKHVCGRRDEGVSIEVRARGEGTATVVEVVDDGDGFALDQLKGGHGLDTLQGRLRALYGAGAALEFERRPGGMLVRLRLPGVVPGGSPAR